MPILGLDATRIRESHQSGGTGFPHRPHEMPGGAACGAPGEFVPRDAVECRIRPRPDAPMRPSREPARTVAPGPASAWRDRPRAQTRARSIPPMQRALDGARARTTAPARETATPAWASSGAGRGEASRQPKMSRFAPAGWRMSGHRETAEFPVVRSPKSARPARHLVSCSPRGRVARLATACAAISAGRRSRRPRSALRRASRVSRRASTRRRHPA